MAGFAWVTLATNDSYSLGALVLAHSLRRVGTQHDLAVLITPGVSEPMRQKLASVFTLVREVNILDSQDEANLAILQRPELGITFTKLHCWRLTEYEKCVFVDADALVVKNCDELFEREELSAAPDVGWPDCFNSGVFVFRPSQQTFASLAQFAASQGSFDGADQGLLNMYFSDWAHKDISKHLPFIYNMCSTATYSYAPAFKQYGDDVKIIHFIGNTKPWLQYFDTLTGIVQPPPTCSHLQPLLQVWWNIFCDKVHSQLTDVMVARTMASIWQFSDPNSIDMIPGNYPSFTSNPDDDAYNLSASGDSDFSEFQDPWDQYVKQTESFVEKISQQTHHTEESKCYIDVGVTNAPPQNDQCCDIEPNPLLSSGLRELPISFALHCGETIQSLEQESFAAEEDNEGTSFHHASQSAFKSLDDQKSIHCRESAVQNPSPDECTRQSHSPTNHDQISDHNDQKSFGDSDLYHTSSTYRQDSSNHHGIREVKQTDSQTPSPSQSPLPDRTPHSIATRTELSASPYVENEDGGLAGALSKLAMGESRTDEQQAIEDHMRKLNWEQGNIDFMGQDSFDNILKRINETLSATPSKEESPSTKETQQPKKSGGKSSQVEAVVEENKVDSTGSLKSGIAQPTEKSEKTSKDKERFK